MLIHGVPPLDPTAQKATLPRAQLSPINTNIDTKKPLRSIDYANL
jgi:hypothetical protein